MNNAQQRQHESAQAKIDVIDDEIRLLEVEIKALQKELDTLLSKRIRLLEWRQKLVFSAQFEGEHQKNT